MEQKLEEIKNEDSEQAKEYFNFIKSSVADGSYFKDAVNWYFFRYVTPICDRTLLIFGAMIAAVVFYFLWQMIQGAFPLVVQEPVFIRAKDQSKIFPSLVALKPKKSQADYDQAIKTVDEAVLKYLLSVYVEDRESYDFSKARIEDVNQKFNRIRNTSMESEYKNFQLIMSKDNPASPIHNFGQNVIKKITIDSVHFVKIGTQYFAARALQYLSNDIPKEAEIRFSAITTTIDAYGEAKYNRESYLAKIIFAFDGVDKNNKSGILRFTVNNYQLFKVR